jgi:hypothetical protein
MNSCKNTESGVPNAYKVECPFAVGTVKGNIVFFYISLPQSSLYNLSLKLVAGPECELQA